MNWEPIDAVLSELALVKEEIVRILATRQHDSVADFNVADFNVADFNVADFNVADFNVADFLAKVINREIERAGSDYRVSG